MNSNYKIHQIECVQSPHFTKNYLETKKKINSTTQAFSLIELLVVVAILGIISAIGIVSYNGYISSTKKKSVENAMMQMSLAQTEFYSNNGYYYPQSTSNALKFPLHSDPVIVAKASWIGRLFSVFDNAFKTSTPLFITSAPIPSPGITAILYIFHP